MRSLIENKRGQIQGVILAVITIFILGIIIFFLNHMNEKVYSKFDEYFEKNTKLNNTEAHETVKDLQRTEQSRIWDYAFLAIYIGIMIQMLVFAFASRTNVVFFWIFVLFGIVILIVGTMLSNIWQEVATNPEFSETIQRFSITNTILGDSFPIIITGILFLAMIIMFGKFPGGRDE